PGAHRAWPGRRRVRTSPARLLWARRDGGDRNPLTHPLARMASSRPDEAAASVPRARERSAAQLLGDIETAIAHGDTGRDVVLVIALNRSDRIDALTRAPDDRPVLDEIGRRMESVLRPADRYAFASREEAW